jgi:DMSO/TMAO reductase YedYZ molybdopterin-dependent catalytic subunit
MKRIDATAGCGLVAVVLLVWSAAHWAHAAPVAEPAGEPAVLQIEGDVAHPCVLRLDSLRARPAEEIDWSHQGESHRYRGIALDALLGSCGIEPGAGGGAAPKGTKHAGLKLVIVAAAADGYQAVFSYAELAAAGGATKAWLVWDMDGKPLPELMAPLRILVPTDAGGDRCIYQVSRLTVVDMRKVVPTAAASK